MSKLDELMLLNGVEKTETDSEKIARLEHTLNNLILMQGLTAKQIDDYQFEVVKDEMPSGDYTNPIEFIPYTDMRVTKGLWYYLDDKDMPKECINNGYCNRWDDEDYLVF